MKNTRKWVVEILEANPNATVEEIRSSTHNRLTHIEIAEVLETLIKEGELNDEEDKQDEPEEENRTNS